MISIKAKKFIAHKIRVNLKEGYPEQQSIAIAISQARRKGFHIPYKK